LGPKATGYDGPVGGHSTVDAVTSWSSPNELTEYFMAKLRNEFAAPLQHRDLIQSLLKKSRRIDLGVSKSLLVEVRQEGGALEPIDIFMLSGIALGELVLSVALPRGRAVDPALLEQCHVDTWACMLRANGSPEDRLLDHLGDLFFNERLVPWLNNLDLIRASGGRGNRERQIHAIYGAIRRDLGIRRDLDRPSTTALAVQVLDKLELKQIHTDIEGSGFIEMFLAPGNPHTPRGTAALLLRGSDGALRVGAHQLRDLLSKMLGIKRPRKDRGQTEPKTESLEQIDEREDWAATSAEQELAVEGTALIQEYLAKRQAEVKPTLPTAAVIRNFIELGSERTTFAEVADDEGFDEHEVRRAYQAERARCEKALRDQIFPD